MMWRSFNASAMALHRPALTLFLMIALALSGAWSYLTIGRAEDPPFTIKQMVAQVTWPGASATDMATQVVDKIERKLEELAYLDVTVSTVRPGQADILVSLKDETPPAMVPELFYQARKKLGDISSTLPDGVLGPFVNDEFGDLFGIIYAFSGDGFSLPELRHVVEDVREGLLSTPWVGKVLLLGDQKEHLLVEFSHRKLAQIGVSVEDIASIIRSENDIAASGFVDTPSDRLFVRTTPGLDGVSALGRLPVTVNGRSIPLEDIVTVHRGRVDPPVSTILVNGKPALALAISMAPNGNILDLGRAVEARLSSLRETMPLGVHMTRINDQSGVVRQDVRQFEDSFLIALAIVLVVSFVSLGWRTGSVVALSVPLVLAGTLVTMKLLGIDLQRISLGAMIIALGLLVDDSIIAVETMVVKLEQGWDRFRAGSFAYTSTAAPMLTGTLITAAGFMPIGIAQSSTGEYTRDIFRIVGIALLLSWIVAVIFVPYLGAILIPSHEDGSRRVPAHEVEPAYATPFYNGIRTTVIWSIGHRWSVIGLTAATLLLALWGFTIVPQQFFPASDRLEVVVEMRLPEGGSFSATAARVAVLNDILTTDRGVESWIAYTGVGAPRYFLASQPVLETPNYAELVINTKSVEAREALLSKLARVVDEGAAGPFSDVRIRVARLELGPPVGYPVQFRAIGPDPKVLRQIAAEVRQVMRSDPHLRNVSDDWGNYGKAFNIFVDQPKARWLGLSSQSIAGALQTILAGTTVSYFRQGTDAIPIVLRAISDERRELTDLSQVNVRSATGKTVPLAQFATVVPSLEEPTLVRRNRSPAITVRGDIADGTQPPDVTAAVLARLQPIITNLPVGYRIEVAGAVAESEKGQASVNSGIPLMIGATLTLLMIQLQSFGQMLRVVLTAPLGIIGVTAALLACGAPFGFVAMLGAIALSGIIMRNSVILVVQIEANMKAGMQADHAIVQAVLGRTRPILLTAAAAILALIPLAHSVFWGPMAIAIMGGLVSATVQTLLFEPALYAAWNRVPSPKHSRMESSLPQTGLATGQQ